MSRRDFERHLRDHGCSLDHHGAEQDMWINPQNQNKAAVPRHRTIKPGLARGICRKLGIPTPPGL